MKLRGTWLHRCVDESVSLEVVARHITATASIYQGRLSYYTLVLFNRNIHFRTERSLLISQLVRGRKTDVSFAIQFINKDCSCKRLERKHRTFVSLSLKKDQMQAWISFLSVLSVLKDCQLKVLSFIAHYMEYNRVLIEHHQQFMSRWQLLATHKLAAEVVISCLTKEKWHNDSCWENRVTAINSPKYQKFSDQHSQCNERYPSWCKYWGRLFLVWWHVIQLSSFCVMMMVVDSMMN